MAPQQREGGFLTSVIAGRFFAVKNDYMGTLRASMLRKGVPSHEKPLSYYSECGMLYLLACSL
jgi:hypothetical protein